MSEEQREHVELSFQWVVGDTVPLEKNLTELVNSTYVYVVTVVSRVVAYALTFAVAFVLLPGVQLSTIFLIAICGSLSIWVSWGFTILSFRTLERLLANDASRVGWNTVILDSYGVTWNTETAQDYTSWLGVSEVLERDGSLWIKTGPAHGFYLPPAAFSKPERLRECVDLISQFRSAPLQPRHLTSFDEPLIKH